MCSLRGYDAAAGWSWDISDDVQQSCAWSRQDTARHCSRRTNDSATGTSHLQSLLAAHLRCQVHPPFTRHRGIVCAIRRQYAVITP